MSGITAAFVRRPSLATVVVLPTVLAGTIAYPGLVQQQFPNADIPVIQGIASYPGASPSTIRDTVARPIEDQLAGVRNWITFKRRFSKVARRSRHFSRWSRTKPPT